ncbi:MAG: 3-deoxy-manno-octulosonate cytidylyltransferase [Gammaproteobacteria bacterium]|nr:3-deoxy-manno-octulosonate cytidylyltransferase [Gammaproteobacteria bacterium]MBT8104664.1 3-deoxy-manno-octulosonate cytidylyltransferase [Gammaproteobacteria bacterium]NNF50454.1 3-deoxy-manno-octulosonate cytidylyltransferase [Woeseiaceae bacterium]NNK24678.1 3-deoxy-manno-octulosonate cytidylyltransferase [Woeseiaceae bacterium]NNL62463.1 3-deoxy-manno-octulosonate cytidylyltransferase [Woeseiaceae bacterium]
MADFAVVIPARYASQRLPGKPLATIAGSPMIRHVWERARESKADEVVIATDDERIAAAAEAFGAVVCMTGGHHRSGTERIAEVADLLDWADERIVVNLQGDEPTMPAQLIDECAGLLEDASADIATLASPFASQADFQSPNCVKVVRDAQHHAIYFSRATIPYPRDAVSGERASRAALHHHGIYAYRCGVLRRLVAAEPSELEICEQLEQLRALALGMTIAVGVPSQRPGAGVDIPEDIARVEAELTQ